MNRDSDHISPRLPQEGFNKDGLTNDHQSKAIFDAGQPYFIK
ncbi:hypothetical protein [uncultured Desulfosarcina sp.]|nr:hypothetical protein [uncultured Desulfosarcina sp.]